MELKLREIKHGQIRKFKFGLQVIEPDDWEIQEGWVVDIIDDESGEPTGLKQFTNLVPQSLQADYYTVLAAKSGWFEEGHGPQSRDDVDDMEESEVLDAAVLVIKAYTDAVTLKKK